MYQIDISCRQRIDCRIIDQRTDKKKDLKTLYEGLPIFSQLYGFVITLIINDKQTNVLLMSRRQVGESKDGGGLLQVIQDTNQFASNRGKILENA